jgi:hypothetical protein
LVAVGVAAPAFAVSGPVQVGSVTVCQCEGQGTKKYALAVTFTNTTGSSVTLTNVVIGETGNTITNQSPPPATPVIVPPGGTTVTFYFNRQSNGANGTFSVAFTPGLLPRQTYTTPTAIPATNPCGPGVCP